MGFAAATMTAEEAAAFLGMEIGPFRRAVERGDLPKPLIRSRPLRWSKVQIEWALEGKGGIAPASESVDPIMGRIDAL